MTQVIVNKKKIIKAIKKEPLRAGSFLDTTLKSERLYDRADDLFALGRAEAYNAAVDQAGEVEQGEVSLKSLKRKDCTVCAVGAVFRNVLNPDVEASSIWRLSEKLGRATPNTYFSDYVGDKKLFREGVRLEAKAVLSTGRYMEALSIYFEGLCDSELAMSHVRERLITFVEREFPKTITLDINGFDPAKDVTVVKS